ncbi:MAG: hypothetical protein ACE5G2_02405 [Candidatus Krumholzibacteriia bacterium]
MSRIALILLLLTLPGFSTGVSAAVNLSDLEPLPAPARLEVVPLRVAGNVISPRGTLESDGAILEYRFREQGVSITHDVAARAMDRILINDLFGLHQWLRDIQRNNRDLHHVFVGRGDIPPRVRGDDEIGPLAEAFDAMTAGLAEAERTHAGRARLRGR